jgi:hypothetical protein
MAIFPVSLIRRQPAGLIPLAALAVSLAGCGPKQAAITGRVLLDGKPLPGGRVTFRPENSAFSSVSAELNEQGQYEAVLLPVGTVHVTVDNRELEPRPPRSSISSALPNLPPELKSKIGSGPPRSAPTTPKSPGRYVKIPERYYLTESEELDFTVDGNTQQQHDVELKSN